MLQFPVCSPIAGYASILFRTMRRRYLCKIETHQDHHYSQRDVRSKWGGARSAGVTLTERLCGEDAAAREPAGARDRPASPGALERHADGPRGGQPRHRAGPLRAIAPKRSLKVHVAGFLPDPADSFETSKACLSEEKCFICYGLLCNPIFQDLRFEALNLDVCELKSCKLATWPVFTLGLRGRPCFLGGPDS